MPDLAAIDPEHHAQFLQLYGADAPQETADKFALAFPAELTYDLGLVETAQRDRRRAERAYEAAKAGEVAAIRTAYRQGATAVELAGTLKLSVARVYQLVAGARK